MYIYIYIYIYTRACNLFELPCAKKKEKEREGEGEEGRRCPGRHEGPSLHKSALRPRRALSTSTSNKSKPREQAWPFAIRRRERESFINLRARTTYSREKRGLMSPGPRLLENGPRCRGK